jgi:hypothetical protein
MSPFPRTGLSTSIVHKLGASKPMSHMSCTGALVILPNVALGFIEQLLVGVELVLQERPPQFLLHQPLSLTGPLPVGEADLLHDVVNVRDDALDDNVRVGVLGRAWPGSASARSSSGWISCLLPLPHKARVARQSAPYSCVNRSTVLQVRVPG